MASKMRDTDGNEEEIQEAFNAFGDGKSITAASLGKALKSMGKEFSDAEVKQLIEIVGDGSSVSFAHFKNMMTSR